MTPQESASAPRPDRKKPARKSADMPKSGPVEGPPSAASRLEAAGGGGLARRIAALTCGIQGAALVAFCVFYAWELARGESDDAMRVVMSIVLIAVFALGLILLARAWLGRADWPITPTVVWNLLLLPVAWGLFQSGRPLVGGVVAVIAVVGILAALSAKPAPEPD